MDTPSRVRVTGPLGPYRVGFAAALAGMGYSRFTATSLLYSMAHLSRWMAARGLQASDLTPLRVDDYLHDRALEGQARRWPSRGLSPLLGYLREVEAVPAPLPPVSTLAEQISDAFSDDLLDRRGLAEATAADYRKVAVSFLSTCSGPGGNLDLEHLSAADVNAFVLALSSRRGVGSLNNVVTALRAMLRFLHVHGYIDQPLVAAIPRTATRRSSPTPVLTDRQVARLLVSCDRRTTIGRRDHAILTVLARLGLRAGEVAALKVHDVDWRAGEVVVPGKGGRRERMPLPHDVGQTVAAYCSRGRRQGDDRHLFVHARAPYGGLTPSAVTAVVYRACDRTDLPRVGAHRLRHATATALRRAGAPLTEISQVLRHRHTSTTTTYAQEDLGALADLARPWPGGVA